MGDRRRNYVMRRYIEAAVADVVAGAKGIRGAAQTLCALGVPITVAVRVLARRRD